MIYPTYEIVSINFYRLKIMWNVIRFSCQLCIKTSNSKVEYKSPKLEVVGSNPT